MKNTKNLSLPENYTIEGLKKTAKDSITKVAKVEKSTITAEGYLKMTESRDESIALYNLAHRVRVFDMALATADPIAAMAVTYRVPRMNTKGTTPSVRLSILDLLKYANSNNKVILNSDTVRKGIESVTEQVNKAVKTAITNKDGNFPTKGVKASLESLLQSINPAWHGTSADARFLSLAVSKAGRTIGTMASSTPESVARFLTDVIHTKVTNNPYRIETAEDLAVLKAEAEMD